MCRSSPFRSNLNTSYITGLDMCEVCTETVHSVALWTRVTLQLWTCVKYRSSPLWTWVTSQVWTCVKFVHVWSMYRDSPFRSTLNTSLTRTRTPTRAVFDPVAKSQFLCFQCREKCPPRTIAHSTLQWDPAMAPSTPSKLVVTLPPNQSTLLPQSRFVHARPNHQP